MTATTADPGAILDLLARLHHGLVAIAPFLDGKGRLARLVTDQAARELLGASVAPDLVRDHVAYHAALSQADNDDFSSLVALMRAALGR